MITSTDKAALLSRSTLFSHLNSEELKKLGAFARQKSLRSKDILFHKGDSGNQMFMIVCGRVKISILSTEGKELILGILEAGNFFGEISLFDSQKRSATTTAMELTDLSTYGGCPASRK